MRWPPYFILAYLALGVQAGVGADVAVGLAQPNLVLIAAIFIALHAPRDSALLGCFAMGLLQDLLTLQPLGLFALSYGLVGLFVVSSQEIVYREHPLTHVLLTLAGSLMTGGVLLVHAWVRGPSLPVGSVLMSALYTAAVAPAVLWPLARFRRVFAFQSPRRRLM